MSVPNDSFGRVGRWLDGEDVRLSPQERALADEIRQDLGAVGSALDAAPPPGVLHRVHGRLSRRLRRRSLAGRALAGAALAAAAVVLAATLWPGQPGRSGGQRARGVLAEVPGEWVVESPPDALDAQVEALSEDIADLQVALSLGDDWPFETAVSAIEDDLESVRPDEIQPLAPPGEPW